MRLPIVVRHRVRVCLIFVLLPSALTLHAQSGQAGQAATNVGADVILGVTKVKGLKLVTTSSTAPTDASCRANLGVPCYSPQEMRKAYGVTPILEAGYTGAGQTIIIIDSFGSPTIASDLHSFDVGYGLPDPPSLTVLAPLGTVPFDPTNSDAVGWAFETTLDVEWAHAMAPGAKIVLLTSPVDETDGVQGMPEFLSLEQYALDHNLGKIISQSWGTAENTLFTPEGEQVLAAFESFYQEAAQQNITVLASAGDSGSANVELNGTTYYPFPTVSFPASSPFVTAVGGTSLYLDTSGNYQSETVWNNSYGAGGGGVSQKFPEPSYQYWLSPSLQKILAGHRAVPDVAYNAGTPISIYSSFLGPASTGYFFTFGTSQGSPQWAGIVADLNQLVGHPLGFLNPQLYSLGALGLQTDLFHDITVGNNSFSGVPGYSATVGFDLASGWGTPNLTPSPSTWSGALPSSNNEAGSQLP
jgi:subtilase family serine protease